MTTGIETTTAFLHSCRTAIRFGSILNESATRLSCCCAISNGFSRRWETGASTVVTESLLESAAKRQVPAGEYKPVGPLYRMVKGTVSTLGWPWPVGYAVTRTL